MADREGKPGHPGKPGSPGIGGGGKGGTGGQGGHGGSAAVEHSRLQWLLAFVSIIAVGLSVGTLILLERVTSNTHRISSQESQIQRLEQRDVMALRRDDAKHLLAIQLIRNTTYRICVRRQVNVAVINLSGAVVQLPLFDCAPDLYGGVARRLTHSESIAFERYVSRTPTARLP